MILETSHAQVYLHRKQSGGAYDAHQDVSINRAPVLTLWAAVVAERLGFNEDEALSLGKALAGLNAQTKGRRLGIYKPHEEGADLGVIERLPKERD